MFIFRDNFVNIITFFLKNDTIEYIDYNSEINFFKYCLNNLSFHGNALNTAFMPSKYFLLIYLFI